MSRPVPDTLVRQGIIRCRGRRQFLSIRRCSTIPEFSVVAIADHTLTWRIIPLHGGEIVQILNVGGSGGFGFRGHTGVEVELLSIDIGAATLRLTPNPRA